MTFGKTLLSSAPAALALGLALPIAAGLLGTLAPALRGRGFAALTAWDGLWCAVKLSIGTGLTSTLSALIITLLIIAALSGSQSFALKLDYPQLPAGTISGGDTGGPGACTGVPGTVPAYPNWPRGTHAAAGDHLSYQGKIYKAKWWTTAVPGSDSSWQLVCDLPA